MTLALMVAGGGACMLLSGLAGWGSLDRVVVPAFRSEGPFHEPCLPGFAFLVLGLGLAVAEKFPRVSQALALGAGLPAFISFVGSLYGVQPDFGIEPHLWIPLPVALPFFALFLGTLTARPDKGFVQIITDDGVGGLALRRLIPAAVLLPVGIGGLRLQAERLGFFDTAFGLTLFAVSNVVTFHFLICWNARSLFQLDARRKQAHAQLNKANRALKAVSECNLALVRASDERELLREICRAIVEYGGYRFAWIGLNGREGGRDMSPVVSRGSGEIFYRSQAIAELPSVWGQCPILETAQTGVSHFIQDIQSEPSCAVCRGRAADCGLSSLITFPLKVEEEVLGVLIIYEAKKSALDPEEIHLLRELMDDLAYGIKALRTKIAHHEAETLLRKREATLAKAQEIARLGSWEWDPVSDVLAWSDEVYRIFGVSPQEFFPSYRRFLELIHPDDRAKVIAAVDRTIEHGIPYRIEHRIVVPSGEVRIVLEQAEVTMDESGRPIRFFGTVMDITERKHLEQQLFQSQKMEALGQLAAGIAHDFNNTLQAILNYGQFVQEELPADSRSSEDLREVIKAAHRAGELSRQLLSFSRQTELSIVPLDPRLLVKEIVRLMQRTVPPSIAITHEAPENLPRIMGDVAHLHQVLLNLCVNAKDAMPEGGSLALAARPFVLSPDAARFRHNVNPGVYVMLSVRDTGEGIAPEDLPRIYEPFFTTKERGKGTGLGLATTYNIVRQHGGFIECESRQGEGTTFRVYLPAWEGDEPKIGEADQRSSLPGGSEQILVVDDQEPVRTLLQRTLEKLGYRVLVAEDGEQALAIFSERKELIDLVLLDLQMPRMDGLACCQAILRTRPDARVILSSGYYNSEIHETAMGYGVQAFLRKPYQMQELASQIRRVLNN
ncbi:MAG: Sensor histidine kinase RcsC [bacterium]|nr:Sensor histidine kinase RcsC [bacterium]